jgi:hypothetical protein
MCRLEELAWFGVGLSTHNYMPSTGLQIISPSHLVHEINIYTGGLFWSFLLFLARTRIFSLLLAASPSSSSYDRPHPSLCVPFAAGWGCFVLAFGVLISLFRTVGLGVSLVSCKPSMVLRWTRGWPGWISPSLFILCFLFCHLVYRKANRQACPF